MTNIQKYDIPDMGMEKTHSELIEALYHALDTLSDRDRFIICSLYGVGTPRLTQMQLSQKLGIPQQTISYKMQKILKNLRITLVKSGFLHYI